MRSGPRVLPAHNTLITGSCRRAWARFCGPGAELWPTCPLEHPISKVNGQEAAPPTGSGGIPSTAAPGRRAGGRTAVLDQNAKVLESELRSAELIELAQCFAIPTPPETRSGRFTLSWRTGRKKPPGHPFSVKALRETEPLAGGAAFIVKGDPSIRSGSPRQPDAAAGSGFSGETHIYSQEGCVSKRDVEQSTSNICRQNSRGGARLSVVAGLNWSNSPPCLVLLTWRVRSGSNRSPSGRRPNGL